MSTIFSRILSLLIKDEKEKLREIKSKLSVCLFNNLKESEYHTSNCIYFILDIVFLKIFIFIHVSQLNNPIIKYKVSFSTLTISDKFHKYIVAPLLYYIPTYYSKLSSYTLS